MGVGWWGCIVISRCCVSVWGHDGISVCSAELERSSPLIWGWGCLCGDGVGVRMILVWG